MNKLLSLSLVVLLGSCMSINRARKVFDRNPQEAARYALEKFPTKDSTIIITKEPDSAIIRKSIDSAVSVQDSICREYANSMNQLLDEMRKSGEATKTTSKPLQIRIDSLKKDYQSKVRKEAERLAKDIPPVVKTVEHWEEDPRKVYLLQIEVNKEKTLREEYEKKFKIWRKRGVISILLLIIAFCYIFRKPLGRFFRGTILRLLGVPKIPPV